jgi:predicted component of type VI protein secretion system
MYGHLVVDHLMHEFKERSLPMTDEHTIDESWREVGRQFQALGEGLAQAFRTAWESEENRQQVENMRTGLESMVEHVNRAIQDVCDSPEGQKVRSEVDRAAQSARAAGEKAVQDIQPHLLSALNYVNDEIQKIINRMEPKESAD